MNKPDIIDIVDDRLEKRFESYAQSQIKLHQEYHDKILVAIDEKIGQSISKYVNGKIDKLNEKTDKQDIILERLDKSIQPFEYTRSWFVSFKDGVSWVAGFITPFGVIAGAIWFIFKQLK